MSSTLTKARRPRSTTRREGPAAVTLYRLVDETGTVQLDGLTRQRAHEHAADMNGSFLAKRPVRVEAYQARLSPKSLAVTLLQNALGADVELERTGGQLRLSLCRDAERIDMTGDLFAAVAGTLRAFASEYASMAKRVERTGSTIAALQAKGGAA